MADAATDYDRLQALIATAVVDPLVRAQLTGGASSAALLDLGLSTTEVELIESLKARDLVTLAEGLERCMRARRSCVVATGVPGLPRTWLE